MRVFRYPPVWWGGVLLVLGVSFAVLSVFGLRLDGVCYCFAEGVGGDGFRGF